MKLFSIVFAVLTVLAASIQVFAWDNLDHEIFDMVSELEAAEGKGTTFYSWLDVPSTASTSDIAKAYRKKSMLLHPDKNPNVKGIHERFSRLGKVSTILRNKEKRTRYDFFYKNGVPKWRGTGYYYSRFRPGLGTVAVFLIVISSGVQFMVQSMNYKRDLARIEVIKDKAKAAAWGPKMVPITGQRKVKVNLGGEAYDEDGNAYNNSKWIDMVVDGSDVYMFDDNGDQVLLNADAAPRPVVSKTWFISLMTGLAWKATGKKPKESERLANADVEGSDDDTSSAAGSDAPGSGTTTPGGSKTVYAATTKAGGKRRKVVKRK
ncbi:hypothetical protein BKA70DRAFT_1257188 [Coprinopsis sp. MPI-PUGE-AT-0042]|nr:hypothetical protein BKA70DRAFT_1257188 [Coprinopsis sp. MPI-PUGE-AT-0042]